VIKGLYAAASAMLAAMHQQSTLAHNVANMDTPGFKQVLLGLKDFVHQPVLQPVSVPNQPANTLGNYLGMIGLGVDTGPETTDFAEGPLQATGEPLDFAINGPGFFKIRTPDGDAYTRDGRFLLDKEGNLVTVDGYPVLDDGDQPIQIDEEGVLLVDSQGVMYVEGEEVAALGIHAFNDPAASLQRTGSNYYTATGEPEDEEMGMVAQGYVEASNANAADLMTRMTQVARHYEAAQKMVQNQDQLLGETINTLGKL
jgi:flagellar basal body rod protein FlgG